MGLPRKLRNLNGESERCTVSNIVGAYIDSSKEGNEFDESSDCEMNNRIDWGINEIFYSNFIIYSSKKGNYEKIYDNIIASQSKGNFENWR